MMLKTYEVTNLFNGKVDQVLAYHMEDAMISFLCSKFFPDCVVPAVREQIRMYGLSSVARIGVLQPNHLIWEGRGYDGQCGFAEWEFVLKG